MKLDLTLNEINTIMRRWDSFPTPLLLWAA
jgi:hypothetical protein